MPDFPISVIGQSPSHTTAAAAHHIHQAKGAVWEAYDCSSWKGAKQDTMQRLARMNGIIEVFDWLHTI